MKKPTKTRWHRPTISIVTLVAAAASFGWSAIWAILFGILASLPVGILIGIVMYAIHGEMVGKLRMEGFLGYAAPVLVAGFTYLFAPDPIALHLGLGVFAAQWLKNLIDKAVYGSFRWEEPA